MVSFSSFVGEDAAAKLEPFATLTPTDSLVNRDLEKVYSVLSFQLFAWLSKFYDQW
jgi:hypothetical protein